MRKQNQSNSLNNPIGVTLDSVFINLYEVGNMKYPSYVFYYFRVKNFSNNPIKINIRRYDYESTARDKTFCVFKKDTLELYGGNFTAGEFVLQPNKDLHVDFNPSPEELYDLYQVNKNRYKSEQAFLKDFSEHSTICFSWDKAMIIDKSVNRKIIFRNPNDSTIQEWK